MISLNLLKPLVDGGQIVRPDLTDTVQHTDMGQRAGNVLLVQPPIVRQRLEKAHRQRIIRRPAAGFSVFPRLGRTLG